jgi:hypothetical protein
MMLKQELVFWRKEEVCSVWDTVLWTKGNVTDGGVTGLGEKLVMALFSPPDEEKSPNARLFARVRHASSIDMASLGPGWIPLALALEPPGFCGTTFIDT